MDLLKFSSYLNNQGFTISVDDILASLKTSIYNRDDIVGLRVCWCKTKWQWDALPELYLSYKEVEGFLKSKSEKEESLKAQKSQIEKEKQEELNKLNKDAGYNRLEEYNKEIEQETKRLEDCLWSGKMEDAEDAQKKLEGLYKQAEAQKNLADKEKSIKKKYDQKATELKKQAEAEQKRIQAEIDKIASVNHRPEFDHEKAYAKVKAREFNSDVLDKTITQLSNEETKALYQYVRKNANHFYTRMMRNVRAMSSRKVDMQETIKQACKTGGSPLEIIRNKPKRSKASLVLVLDISGSCIKASRVMLSFMHILSRVFTRVKCFVFVNRLYDVSKALDTKDTEQAVNEVMNTIQTRGVYSDYYKPLETLNREYGNIFNKDTTVIFIGDARNNQNPTGEKYFKGITRKSRKAYFLNTEPVGKWNQGDSIMGIYSKYAEPKEGTQVGDIMDFIDKMR